MKRRLLPAALAAAALALAGCASTVPMTTTVADGTGAGQGDGLSGTGTGGTAGGGTSGGTSAAGGVGGGGTTGGGAVGSTGSGTTATRPGGAAAAGAGGFGGAPGGPAGAAGSIPPTGRGWDKSFVYIGVTTQKDAQKAFANAGATAVDPGDQEGDALAMAAYLNRRGGVFGRKVKIVFLDENTVTTAQDPNTAGNAACTYFTQDHPVIGLLNAVTLMDVPSFRACMAKGKVPLFSASVAAVDKKVGASLAPYFYQLLAPTWDALAPVLVARLKAQGYFTGWNTSTGAPGPAPVKVGVLVPSDDVGQRVGKAVTSALASVGISDPVVYAYQSGGDFSSAVLQMSGNGVTHVLTVNSDLLPFQLSANSQNYHPRYGFTTLAAPQTFLQATSPRGQNNGALGVGWSPSFDVGESDDVFQTPGEKLCTDALAQGGQTYSGKRFAEAVGFAFCDGIRVIADSATAGGGFDGTALYNGVQRNATTFLTAFSFANGLGPGRLFVPGGVRDLGFVSSCSCFRYSGSSMYRL